MTSFPILTATTFLPLVGAAVVVLFGSEQRARWIALATTLFTLAVSAPLGNRATACKSFPGQHPRWPSTLAKRPY